MTEHGVPQNHAEIVADCFVTADLYGVTSHGVSILPSHIQRIERGGYNLNPDIKVIKETAAFAVIDGDNAMGPVSATFCMDYAVEKCRSSGVFTVFSRNNNTFGPAFYYSLKAAEKGCIAFICSNSPAQMAPVGGKDKMLGTNPFSIVFPIPDSDPIIIDMATSVVAKSKFKEYKAEGKPLPEGWALDKDGNPTTDADEGMAGFVQPMAGFKGYAISMLIDIVSGVLSGAAYLDKVGRFYSEGSCSMNVGFYLTAIDPQVVCGEDYDTEIKAYEERLKNSACADGQRIVLPGEDRIVNKNKITDGSK
ncbi:MAG: Ldh family oxidoreductase [Clostridia bacterium]|nr:Ldh family oxidoreductase [Clostridia bacterium]